MPENSVTKAVLQNADRVQAILLEVPDLIVTREQEDIFSVEDPETGVALVIDAEEHIVSIFADVSEVPTLGREDLFSKLLTLNGNILHGAFYIDREHVFIMENLEAEHLDANELIAAIKSMMFAIVTLDAALESA